MALANGLDYQRTTKGLTFPSTHAPGRGALAGTPKDANNPPPPAANGYAADTVLLPVPDPANPGKYKPNSVNRNAAAAPVAGTYVTNEVVAANPTDSLVAQLDLLMQRRSLNRADAPGDPPPPPLGGTTNGQQQITAFMQYLADTGPANRAYVAYQSEGTNITNPGNIGPAGNKVTATDASVAGHPTFDYIYNQVAAGNMVKLGRTGHAVLVVAAGSVLGNNWVAMLSDLKQTGQNDPTDSNLAGFGSFGLEFSWLTGNATLTLPQIANRTVVNVITLATVPEPAALSMLVLCGVIVAGRRNRTKRDR